MCIRDRDRVYTLASHNYMLKSGGDGYTMFQGCTLLKDETVLDNQALIRYLGQILEGDLSAYSAPGGQGRIQIAETAEETGGAPAEPEEPAAGARIYVVQPGDCLWTIARQELGGGLDVYKRQGPSSRCGWAGPCRCSPHRGMLWGTPR